MAERNLAVDHTTVWRWVRHMRRKFGSDYKASLSTSARHGSWMKHTGVWPGHWINLFRAVDNRGDTVDFFLSETRDHDAAKRFLQTALANPDNWPPRVFSVDGNRSYRAPIRELCNDGEFVTKCRYRRPRYRNNRIESRSPARETPVASHAVRTHHRDGTRSDSRDRSNTDDQKRPSPWDSSAQSARTGVGLRSTPRCEVTRSSAIMITQLSANLKLQHFQLGRFGGGYSTRFGGFLA